MTAEERTEHVLTMVLSYPDVILDKSAKYWLKRIMVEQFEQVIELDRQRIWDAIDNIDISEYSSMKGGPSITKQNIKAIIFLEE